MLQRIVELLIVLVAIGFVLGGAMLLSGMAHVNTGMRL